MRKIIKNKSPLVGLKIVGGVIFKTGLYIGGEKVMRQNHWWTIEDADGDLWPAWCCPQRAGVLQMMGKLAKPIKNTKVVKVKMVKVDA